MAKTNAPAKEKLSFPKKFVLFFKNLGLRIGGSFKDMYSELKKVTWPTRKEMINYTLVVLWRSCWSWASSSVCWTAAWLGWSAPSSAPDREKIWLSNRSPSGT